MAAAVIPEKSVRIRALKKFRYSPNGWDNAVLPEGEEADVRPIVARCGVELEECEIIGDAEEPVIDEDTNGADGPRDIAPPKKKKK